MPLIRKHACAWVFAGGDYSSDHLPAGEVKDTDLVVCVDRGLEYCLQSGLQPDLLIGDLDSVSPDLLQDARVVAVPRHVFPSRKASSDLELALDLLAEDPPARVVLLGVSGGRTDHMLFNWLLPLLRPWPFSLQLVDATTHCHVMGVDKDLSVNVVPGQIVSLLALSLCTGVCTTGLHYVLTDAKLLPGSTLGLSNIAETQRVRISKTNGTLLVLVEK